MSRTITGVNTTGITLSSTADNPVTVQGTISSTAAQLGALYAKGGKGVTWTIDNFGVIGSATATNGPSALYLGGFSSTVSNAAVTNETGGIIGGSAYAIFANGPLNLVNKTGAVLQANSNSTLYLRDAATINNYGTIVDALTNAVYLENGGTVLNHAGATISAPRYAVQGRGTANVTVVNEGTVGTILLNSTAGAHRLIQSPEAVLTGKVNGGKGTLELAVGKGSAGTLQFGSTSISNFKTLQFDSGSKWSVSGTSGALGTMVISGFTQGDTIDLRSFVATSRTFANNALVLKNATATTTLSVQGTFASTDFNIKADGTGGTYITEGPLPGPTITAGDTVTFQGGGSAVTLDPTISITDNQSTTLTSATVGIGTGFVNGDRLNYATQGGITGSFNASTGTLTLSGSASLSAYESALESVTYSFSPANNDPTLGGGSTSRAVSWVVNDGTTASTAGSSTVNVVHVAPTITTSGTVSFSNGGSPAVLAPTVTLADPDSAGNLTGATVTITNFASGDALNFTNRGGITGNYNSGTGVLTLSGAASLANYDAALESVSYSFIPGGDPTLGGQRLSRNLTWVVRDGSSSNGSSAPATTVVNMVPVAPTITIGGTVGYAWSRPAVVLSATPAVSDPDSGGQLAGATIAITGNLQPDDQLSFTNQNGISGNYANGVLTLTGTASLANYQAALASITFSNAASALGTSGVGLARTITWTVSDGQLSSTGATSTVTVAAPGPAIDVTGTTSFTGGGSPITLAGSLALDDPNSASLVAATVAITDEVAGDTLGFTAQNGITGNYDPTTGVLTLSGTASVADYKTALGSITYGFASPGDPTAAGTHLARTITWNVADGSATSATDNSDLTITHAPPTVTVSGTPNFTGGGVAVTLAGAVSLSDPDSGGLLNSGTVVIGGFVAGDVLTADTGATSITASYNNGTGVLTLAGADSIADYEAVLRTVRYATSPANADPTASGARTSRQVQWTVSDGSAQNGLSNAGTTMLGVVHAPPSITVTGGASFMGGGAAVPVVSGIALSDPDSGGNLVGATISIGGFISGDTLSFTNQSGITGSYQPGSGVLTLTGAASIAAYQTVLQSITYGFKAGADPTGGGTHLSRALSWIVTDGNSGAGLSNTGTSNVSTVHAPPVVTAAGTATFSGGGSAVVLDPTIAVADLDSSGLLQGATVSIGGFIPGDLLGFTNQNGITGNYNPTTGVLTLSGAASIAAYGAALASVTYGFTAGGDPTGGGGQSERTISWVANDGVASSVPATSNLATIHMPPTLIADGKAIFTGGGGPVPLDNDVTLVAPDSAGLIAGATVAITGNFLAGDVLNFTAQNGITGSYDPATGALALQGAAPATAYETALESITYGFSPANGDATGGGLAPQRDVTWTINDSVADSAPATSSIDEVHVGPTITTGGNPVFTGGDPPVALSPAITITDPDSGGTLNSAQVAVTDFVAGDTLGFSDQNGITGSYDGNLGVLSLSGVASIAAYEAALGSVTYSFAAGEDPSIDGTDTNRSIGWTVNDGLMDSSLAGSSVTAIDAQPTVDVSGQASYIIHSAPVAVGPSILLSDPDSGGRLAGAAVSISNGLLPGDRLDFDPSLGIGGTYDAPSGTLVFYDAASLSDYQAALRSVTFESTASDPTDGGADPVRTITWQVYDPASVASAAGESSVSVAFAPPVISGAVGDQVTTDEQALNPFAAVSVTDPNPDQTEVVTVIQSDTANGMLSGLTATKLPGQYEVSGTQQEVTAALRAAVFTPTLNEIPPGETATTGFSIQVIDTAQGVANDSATSVTATSIANLPTITHATENRGVAGQSGDTPFRSIVVGDQDVGTTQTITVALGDPASGTLSNLAGGSFDATSGIYTVSGSASDVTTAVQGLVFTPADPPPGAYVRTTGFTITATGPGGTVSDSSISVSTARQVLGLENQTGNASVAVSPDGSSFAAPEQGKVNQAIVSDPVTNGTYRVPTGYQALFLGGSADATLLNDTQAGVLMLGNRGNDTISAGADRVTMAGGAGDNSFVATGNAAVIGTNGRSQVRTTGTGSSVFVGSGALAMSDAGTGTKIGLSSGSAAINLGGSGATVYANSGSLVVSDSGKGDVIGASTGSVAATVSGSEARIYGGDGALTVALTDTARGVAIGTGAGPAVLTVGGSQSSVYGGSGGLTAQIAGTGNVVGLGAGTSALTLSGGAAQVFGGAGAMTVLDTGTADTIGTGAGPANITARGNGLVVASGGGDVQFLATGGASTVFGGSGASTITGGGGAVTAFGGAGGVVTFSGDVGQAVYQAGGGAETLNAAAATSGLVVNGGIDAAGSNVLIAGSGNDSLYAGTGAETMTGGAGSDQFVFYRSVVGNAAPADVITDMSGDDAVYLAGYGADEAARALATASSVGGATTLRLSDNTTLTFLDVSTANLAGRVVSF